MKSLSPNDIVSLTSLRGVLASWIVLYHFWNDVLRLFPGTDIITPLVHRGGQIAVPVFFILSGFVLAYNYTHRFQTFSFKNIWHFLLLRLARIYPVHLVTLLFVLAMVGVSRFWEVDLDPTGYTLRDFILNIFLVHTWIPDARLNWNYPSWSISSEWFAYIFFPVTTLLTSRWITSLRQTIAFLLLTLTSSILLLTFWGGLSFHLLLLVIPTFLSGTAVFGLLRHFPSAIPSNLWIWVPECLVLLAIAVCLIAPPNVALAFLAFSFLSIILVLAWIRGQCHNLWKSAALVFLGEISYSLYMTHTLVQKVVYTLLPSSRFEDSHLVIRIVVIGIYSSLIVGICLACYYWLENPSRKALRKKLINK
jgi:peptidoglycan/LPS O-acetylase OafA/YrhL